MKNLKISPQKLDVILHRIPRMINELQVIEKELLKLKESLLLAIENNNDK